MQKRSRRNRVDIYYEILSIIQEETNNSGGAKPTRIHHLCNLSYDKLVRYLDELESKKLIVRTDVVLLTEKGREFMNQYCKMRNLREKIGFV